MNALTRWNRSRWNQLNKLEDLQHTLRSLFSHSGMREQHSKAPQWIPVVDVSEEPKGYVIKAELPQVRRQDVQITLEEGRLTITGDREFDRNCKTDHPVEHAFGRFSHSFEIPADALPAKVSAKFTNGVLIVHLARNDVIEHQRVEGKGSLATAV